MTDRRSPAAGARRAVSGLSTALSLGLVAAMATQAAAEDAATSVAEAVAPPIDGPVVGQDSRDLLPASEFAPSKRVVVVRRHHIVTSPTPSVRPAAPSVTPPSAPAPRPAPAPPPPVTTSGGS